VQRITCMHACMASIVMVGRRTRGVGCGVPCVWAGRPGGRLGQWNTDRDPDMPAASWFMERGNGMLGACPVQAYVDCVHFSLLFDKIYPIIN
jgi:hypothetical protein